MSIALAVREAFAGYEFGPPVAAGELDAAEAALGHPLPPVVRELYAAFDGFNGPTNASFFLPLTRRPSVRRESLLSFTQFLRAEDYCPEWLGTAIAVGNNGTGPSWFVSIHRPKEVWRWDAEWGDEYETLDGSLLDVWLRDKAMYDALIARHE